MFGRRRHSQVPSLNTTSTADISFMLLVFFLVTSSMDSDKGLRRQLPPPPEEEQQAVDIQQEDLMTVTLSADGTLAVGGDTLTADRLRQRVIEFAAVAPRRRVVVLDVSPDATYNDYFHLQETLVAAYRRLKVSPRISETIDDQRGEESGERKENGQEGGEP